MADAPVQPMADPYGGYGPLIMGVTWAEASLTFVLIAMRTYTNAFIVKSFRWDYWWALLTFVLSLVTQAMLTVSCVSGMGNHIYLLSPDQIVSSLQWSWIGQMILIQTIGFGKIAVIAFLLRIQKRTNSWKDTVLISLLYFVGITNVIININQLVLILVACQPTEKLWNPAIPGNCDGIVRTGNVGYFQGGWASVSDVVLAIYPVFVFWDLKISRRIKLGLCLLMAGGLAAAAAGVTKTVYLKLIATTTDITSAESPLIIWAWTENWLVLILGSLPPIRPLFVSVFRQLSATGSRRKTSGYYQHSGDLHRSNSIPMYPSASTTNGTKNGMNDDDSEKNILPGKLPAGNSILRTTHVHVASKSRNETDDNYEGVLAAERGQAY